MSNRPKIGPAEEEYIRNHREMSERQLAAVLKLSKTTVHRAKKRLGLTDPAAPPRPAPPTPESTPEEPEDKVVLLEHHARRLEAAMANAPAVALVGLSKEYRATLDEIDSLKEEDAEVVPIKAPEKKESAFHALRAGRPPLRAAAQD